MTARLDYGWRLVATGMSFVVFGVCGLLFSLLAYPLARLWPHPASRQRIVTTLIHWFFRALVAALQRTGVMELDVEGVARLRASGPAIVVANHPTYLDVVVLLALTPSACCVVKNAHWGNPCFWGIVRAAAYVSNADPVGFVADCSRQLAAGNTMIIFPEGSRSPAPNRLHAFSRGFAYMRWYHVPSRPFRISVSVLDPVGVERLVIQEASPALAARSVTHAIEKHITQHLFEYGFFKTRN
jgi:1-acyl-sn-glycerol-3-phosphate acyltransferase